MCRKLKLLCVEDSKTEAMLVKHVFSGWFDITLASTVSAAIAEIQKKHHDVVLLDLHLPDGEGIEVFKTVSTVFEAASNEKLPVVVYSSSLDENLIRSLVDHGCQYIFAKDRKTMSELLGEIAKSVLTKTVEKGTQLLEQFSQGSGVLVGGEKKNLEKHRV
jgi:CheY-like chemotaxis protein